MLFDLVLIVMVSGLVGEYMRVYDSSASLILKDFALDVVVSGGLAIALIYIAKYMWLEDKNDKLFYAFAGWLGYYDRNTITNILDGLKGIFEKKGSEKR